MTDLDLLAPQTTCSEHPLTSMAFWKEVQYALLVLNKKNLQTGSDGDQLKNEQEGSRGRHVGGKGGALTCVIDLSGVL